MALPEKNHFPLQEIAARWNVPLHDLQYYAEHGLLEMQTWLDDAIVKLFRQVKTDTGELVFAQTNITSYKGYAILLPEKIRRIFRNHEASTIRCFQSITPGESFEIFDSKLFVLISANDLVISRAERDRFESVYSIDLNDCCCGHVAKAATFDGSPSFAGRPSVMHHILEHFKKRADANLIHSSLAREADYLFQWAEKNIKGCQTPKAKTIKNVLRDDYRAYVNLTGDKAEAA